MNKGKVGLHARARMGMRVGVRVKVEIPSAGTRSTRVHGSVKSDCDWNRYRSVSVHGVKYKRN